MATDLGTVLTHQDGNQLTVELFERRIGVDIHHLERDAPLAQVARECFAKMAITA